MLFKELTREEDLEISRLDGYDEGERASFTKGERAATPYFRSSSTGQWSEPIISV